MRKFIPYCSKIGGGYYKIATFSIVRRLSFKIFMIGVVSLFLLLACSIAFVLPAKKVQAASKNATDFTQLTTQEQAEINKQIEALWGNPQDTQLIEFKNGFTDNDLSKSGDSWYYLTQDVSALCYGEGVPVATTHNIRILLNGYSISGNAGFTADEKNSSISIFDSIPNKKNQASKYQYNANATKYYSYDSATQGYTRFSTNRPNGNEVTSMPSFTADSYIQVTGSALAPNLQQSETQACLNNNVGKLYAFGIHIVGCIPYSDSLIFAYESGELKLVQCTVIGNRSGTFAAVSNASSAIMNKNALLSVYGCKIYGNQVYETEVNYGVPIASSATINREWDIVLDNTTHIKKSNIGSVASIDKSMSYTKAIFLKDVALHEVTINTFDAFVSNLQGMDGLAGTFELIYNTQMQYTGQSPNLNFIVHGKDNDKAPKSGKNRLTVEANATVKTVVISGTAQIESGANIQSVVQTGGRLIDNRVQPTQTTGSVANSSSLVIVQSLANVNTLDLYAGDYLGIGNINSSPTPPNPDQNPTPTPPNPDQNPTPTPPNTDQNPAPTPPNTGTTNTPIESPQQNKNQTTTYILLAVIGGMGIVLIVVLIVWIKRKNKKKD